VEKPSFKEARLVSSKALTFSDAAGQIYFVLVFTDRSKENKYAATLAKIYRSDGLAWSMNYELAFVPREISFQADSGELVIKGRRQSAKYDGQEWKDAEVIRHQPVSSNH
jgi:hypothetical protein